MHWYSDGFIDKRVIGETQEHWRKLYIIHTEVLLNSVNLCSLARASMELPIRGLCLALGRMLIDMLRMYSMLVHV